MGRLKKNFDQMPGRFPAGTLQRIDFVREPGETRTSFVQKAVEALLRQREARKTGDNAKKA